MSLNNLSDKTKIMIVEDSPSQALQLRYILEKHNYYVYEAHDGSMALSLLEEVQPDLILSDIVMPEIDGYELSKRIKASDKLRHIPVILLTSLSEPEDIIKGLQCGADNFVVKPYKEDDLLSRIKYIYANKIVRAEDKVQFGIEITFGGQKYLINSDRFQILNLLVSSFETAVQKNRELLIAQEDIQKANDELFELNKTKDKFFSIIAHDLKSPLSAIMGLSEVLVNDADSLSEEDRQEFRKVIHTSLKNTYSLLDNLLLWANSQTGRIKFSPESHNVNQIIEQLEMVYAGSAANKKQTIVTDLNAVSKIHIDANMINTVIRNLVSNAIKFTRENGVIRISTQEYEDYIEIAVSDNGVGMDDETLSKLFKLDSTQSTLGTANEPGTGLGLFLCKEFVEKNGGEIWIESYKGEGTTFYFSLPK